MSAVIPFHPVAAAGVIAGLPLSRDGRRFAAHWLARIASSTPSDNPLEGLDEDLLERAVAYELTPRAMPFLRSGRAINEGLRMDLRGCDYLAMAPAAQRAERLSRICRIVDGAVSRQQRFAVNTLGKVSFLNETSLPCGLSAAGRPMIMTLVEMSEHPGPLGHVTPTSGVMNIAPVFETYALN